MYIYPDDRKVLKQMIKAQETQSCCVILDTDNCFHHCSNAEYGFENEALANRTFSTQLSPTVFDNALKHLQKEGYIKHLGFSPYYQVTYDGWNVMSVQKHDIIMLIVTHFLFPSAVAFITTLITLFLTKQ